VTFGNKMRGVTYGAELAANWKVTDWWKLAGNYTWLKVDLQNDGSSSPEYSAERSAPQNQFSLRSYWDLPHHFQFDAAAYYVDNVPQYRTTAYTRLDLRLGWQPTKSLDVSFGVQNLLDDRHPEVGPSFGVQPTQLQRSFWTKITWHF
jgi:iron complex outermembrane receptor protein